MTKVITITCDECKKEMDDGWYISYKCSRLEYLNQTMHFCGADHMWEYFKKAFNKKESKDNDVLEEE